MFGAVSFVDVDMKYTISRTGKTSRLIQTTLYELVARVQMAYPDYDDDQVVAVLEHILRYQRLTGTGHTR